MVGNLSTTVMKAKSDKYIVYESSKSNFELLYVYVTIFCFIPSRIIFKANVFNLPRVMKIYNQSSLSLMKVKLDIILFFSLF